MLTEKQKQILQKLTIRKHEIDRQLSTLSRIIDDLNTEEYNFRSKLRKLERLAEEE
jgi:prefoldin subunit 5